MLSERVFEEHWLDRIKVGEDEDVDISEDTFPLAMYSHSASVGNRYPSQSYILCPSSSRFANFARRYCSEIVIIFIGAIVANF